jgi:hypothetical protein
VTLCTLCVAKCPQEQCFMDLMSFSGGPRENGKSGFYCKHHTQHILYCVCRNTNCMKKLLKIHWKEIPKTARLGQRDENMSLRKKSQLYLILLGFCTLSIISCSENKYLRTWSWFCPQMKDQTSAPWVSRSSFTQSLDSHIITSAYAHRIKFGQQTMTENAQKKLWK